MVSVLSFYVMVDVHCFLVLCGVCFVCMCPEYCFLFIRVIRAADIVSAVRFDQTGDFLATGDRGGRVVLFERVSCCLDISCLLLFVGSNR